jgi:hypothetical protein
VFGQGLHDYQPQIAALATALHLPYDQTDQDWGIQHADAARLDEFVQFAQRNFGTAWPADWPIVARLRDWDVPILFAS